MEKMGELNQDFIFTDNGGMRVGVGENVRGLFCLYKGSQ